MNETSKTAVIVGRFQVDNLHEGHKYLIREALKENDRLLVVIGNSPLPPTRNNPLSVLARSKMLAEFLFGEDAAFDITSIDDHPSDDVWSYNLDNLIEQHGGGTIYHGRDSAPLWYSGLYKMYEVETIHTVSATDRRQTIGAESLQLGEDFRRGAIWATQHQFPTVYRTVDIGVIWAGFDEHGNTDRRLLAIRKNHIDGLMLPGGFAEPDSLSDEEDAYRELEEETGLKVDNLKYVGSFKQPDWRYRSEVDCIRTTLFLSEILDTGEGKPPAVEGLDDVDEALWVPCKSLHMPKFHKCHHNLLEALSGASSFIDTFSSYIGDWIPQPTDGPDFHADMGQWEWAENNKRRSSLYKQF